MMYSKPGKISIELFPWIQQKDAIIHGQKKKTYEIPMFGDIPHSQRQYKSFRENIEETSPKKLIKTQVQPFSKQVGRVEPKKELDRYGFYNPKYHLVQKRSPLTDSPDHFRKQEIDRSMSQKSLNHSFKNSVNTSKDACEVSVEFVMKPLPNPKGYVELKKQEHSERFPLPEGPNENRFENHPYPQSQYSRSPNPTIRPQSCKPKIQKLDLKNGQIYDLNYKMIHPKSDKMIPVLDKLTPRKEFNSDKPIYTFSETQAEDVPGRRKSPASFKMDQQISREKALSHYNSIRRLYYL